MYIYIYKTHILIYGNKFELLPRTVIRVSQGVAFYVEISFRQKSRQYPAIFKRKDKISITLTRNVLCDY